MTNRTRHHLRTLTRRTSLYLLLPLALLLTTRLIWGLESAHRLATVKSYLHTKNIDIDHLPVPLPPDHDSFPILLKACEAATLPENDRTFLDGDGLTNMEDMPRTAEDVDRIKMILSSLAPAFESVDDAERNGARTSPSMDISHSLGKMRALTNLLLLDATTAHAAKDDRRALHDFHRILIISKILRQRGTLVDFLVAIALRALAVRTVERLAPDLDLHSSATRDAALALAREFADDAPLKSALLATYEFEIACAGPSIRRYYCLNDWWISPLRDDGIARSMKASALQLDGLAADQWPVANTLFLPDKPPPDSNLNTVTLWGSLDSKYAPRMATLYFRCLADTRAAAILLAARVYSANTGALPSNLPQLVPSLLPTLPIDPFSEPPTPFHFRIDAARLTLWSVGENLTDEGGVVALGPDGNRLQRYENKSPRSQPDIIYGAAWTAAAPPIPPPTPPPPPLPPE